jgi:hypothetical protein
MRKEHLHVTDENLLLHAGGGLPVNSSVQVGAHLEYCARCRTRLRELQSTLAEFGEAHRGAWHTELPPAAGPRARLEARLLAESADAGRRTGWLSAASILLAGQWRALAFGGVALAACVLLALRLYAPAEKSRSMPAALAHWEEPDLRLTPGATIPVTGNQVCGGTAAKTDPVIPVSLKRSVFERYGVTPSQPDDYEVDYLITPQLGGATDIRNLWPEPYQDTVWNAHVKDQLEDRLQLMVCRGDVDLATAQRDISTDWIAAYRKYFHADKPVSDGSSFNSLRLGSSHPST